VPKPIAVILSGCGREDGSDPAETLFTLLVLERAGAQPICAAPEAARAGVARLVGRPVVPLDKLEARRLQGMVIPGGGGTTTVLSDYTTKHELCTVDPSLSALMRALLQSRRPMGFIGSSALLAARVLGPVSGVRITLGPKGTTAAKHAAVMGADVRPATTEDVVFDAKSRVASTPAMLAPPLPAAEGSDPARTDPSTLPGIMRAVDRLVRLVVGGGGQPRPGGRPGAPTDRARGSA
jgi:enhancing lycopene biosynthesis protein 2